MCLAVRAPAYVRPCYTPSAVRVLGGEGGAHMKWGSRDSRAQAAGSAVWTDAVSAGPTGSLS